MALDARFYNKSQELHASLATNIIWEAYLFAEAAHGAINHKRKITGEDYIVHPIEVADVAARVGLSDETIAAAFLHDTIEDTSVSAELVELLFDGEVARLTIGMTDLYTDPKIDGNNAERALKNAHHMWKQDKDILNLKCADMYANLRSLDDADTKEMQKFAKYIIPKMEYKLSGMQNASSHMFDLVADEIKRQKAKFISK